MFAVMTITTISKADDAPTNFIKSRYASILNGPNPISEAKNMLDFQAFLEGALGKHDSEVSSEEKEILRFLLEKIVSKSISTQLRSLKGYSISWNGSTVENDIEIVSSTATSKKGVDIETDVEYHLKKNNGTYKVIDVVIDDVSAIASYKQQFHKIISKEGVKSLIKKMAKKAGVNEEDYGC